MVRQGDGISPVTAIELQDRLQHRRRALRALPLPSLHHLTELLGMRRATPNRYT